MRHRVPATGTLQRNYFFQVRDSDFQRGINKAVANNWLTIDLRNRHRYQLTATGYAYGRMIDRSSEHRTGAMSALGHKRTFALQNVMSALPPKADMCSATLRMSALCQ